jgi:hypothetical protein
MTDSSRITLDLPGADIVTVFYGMQDYEYQVAVDFLAPSQLWMFLINHRNQ